MANTIQARSTVRRATHRLLALLLLTAGFVATADAQVRPDAQTYVVNEAAEGRFPIASSGALATIYADADDYPGVLRAVRDLQADVERVTHQQPALHTDSRPSSNVAIIVGTIGESALIDQLVDSGKLTVTGVAGRWETYVIETVDQPFEGVDQALVIAGSDKRGTVFGVYDVSYQIGVSPWYFWADVPARHQTELHVLAGRYVSSEPAVRYRGIFINDENPALYGWVHETFDGFNADFYETVFELILRLRGNFLWPAMWGKSIYDDDPRSPILADEMGVVLGTSHHEPMTRAHVDWERYGEGDWNYETNPEVLRDFWREGAERMGDKETILTIGMRGDGDEAMTEGTATELLERIVADQRDMIEDVTGRPAEETPQAWALYKEVQEYYDQGMQVPDDVTLIFADDNWGNIRRLPEIGDNRPGGYGIYYHFDYVGGPRSYKWTNTTQIERVWEQMHLAYQYGADRLWVVNVGDIKPMEFPIEFFLDYAWSPDQWPAERLPEYTLRWSERQFGPEYASEIAHVMTKYTEINSRRKPEMVDSLTYSQVNYREAERVVQEYNDVVELAKRIGERLAPEYQDAYYQLVLYMAESAANVQEMHTTVGRNHLYESQGRVSANALAEKVRQHFAYDAELDRRYHEDMADGKWVHMMSQPRIGYTSWSDPPHNIMPELREVTPRPGAAMGVAVEGSADWWPGSSATAVLPELDPFDKHPHYIEVFSRGSESFDFRVEVGAPWLSVSPASGRVTDEQRLHVTVDWDAAPAGRVQVPITISGPNGVRVVVQAPVFNPADNLPAGVFVESDGYISIEAANYSRAVEPAPIRWLTIPNLGRTHHSVTPTPVTHEAQTPGGDSARLEYRIYVHEPVEVQVHTYLSPSFDFMGGDGLLYGISFDDAEPQIVNMHDEGSLKPDIYHADWNRMVANNSQLSTTTHVLDTPGEHVLKFWMVEPGVVLQKIVIDTGGLQPSYLGPPESQVVTVGR